MRSSGVHPAILAAPDRLPGIALPDPKGPDPVTSKETPATRADFGAFYPLDTRWMDNDHYGHVNNVVYYSYFDTAVNGYLMQASGKDIRELPEIGIVAETGCRFMKSLSFPEKLEIGLAVDRLGNSSIVYRIAIFRAGDPEPAAVGKFVHVYVDAASRRPVPVPAVIREAVKPLVRG